MFALSVGLVTSRSATADRSAAAAPAGGAVGTVDSVSTSGFTMTTPAGQPVTVDETTSTASAGAGETVLVLGTTDGTAITATRIVVQPAGDAGSGASPVVPFERGASSAPQQDGRVPAGDTQGSATIVGGTAAEQATEAALAAYPGGIVTVSCS